MNITYSNFMDTLIQLCVFVIMVGIMFYGAGLIIGGPNMGKIFCTKYIRGIRFLIRRLLGMLIWLLNQLKQKV